jgi:signal peptidase
MKYTTADYLRDSYPAIDFFGDLFITFLSWYRRSKKNFGKRLSNIDYLEVLANVWHNLPYGIIIVYLGFLLTFFLFIESEGNSGIDVYTITTASMSPSIIPGSTIVTLKTDDYVIGDIISYRQADSETGVNFSRFLTHRIIDIKDIDSKKVIITKGDANNVPDPYEITLDQIRGKVILIIPLLGYLFFFVKTIPGFLALVVLPVILLVKNEVRYILREVKRG